MPKMDLVFIHAPAVYDFRKRSSLFGPVSDMVPSTPIFEMYPLGLTTMGEYLERHGMHARLYNLAAKMLHIKNFDVERELSKIQTRAFGIDLHWMPHCQGSIEVAKILKRLHPGKPVFFGGISSSIYHEELIRYDCIDYVWRGDSIEEPLRMLMTRIVAADKTHTAIGDLSDIPNLTWKDETGAIHVNPLSWVPDDMNAISMDYAFPMKGVIRDRDLGSYLPTRDWLKYPITCSLVSRGCKRNCTTCGGSHHAYKNHMGRRSVAWRDPDLLVRDIETIQNHISGPFFVLNDFLLAGHDYAYDFISKLDGKLRNSVGFEFFGPPPEGRDFYDHCNRHLDKWSVEISAESHDDGVRAAFGKGHYNTKELEQTIVDALAAGAERFDLYFMTGIPTQTKESVLETGEYVRHLYELVGNDPRLVVMTSPMAPFLDPGSRAFDNPERHGYKLRAKTLEEHRAQMLMPSWKHIMNYESTYMSNDDMVDATYQAGLDLNDLKGELGLIDPETAKRTHDRNIQSHDQMRRLDELIDTLGNYDDARVIFNQEVTDMANESTVAEKTELNWDFNMQSVHITSNAKLWLSQTAKSVASTLRGEPVSAASDFNYAKQENGVRSALKHPLVGGTINPEPREYALEPLTEGEMYGKGLIDLNGKRITSEKERSDAMKKAGDPAFLEELSEQDV